MTPNVRNLALTVHVTTSVGWLGAVIVFVTIELPPGDFADRRAHLHRSQGVMVSQLDVTALRHEMGLDRAR